MNIKLVQICSDKLEFVAEAHANISLDPSNVYDALRTVGLFQTVCFFRTIGVVRVKYQDKSVMIFRNGKMTVNSVKGLSEASDIVHMILRTLNREKKKRLTNDS